MTINRFEKLSIEHFRGIYDAQEISFALPSGGAGSGLTLIVGANNSGKSTILDCIRTFISASNPVEVEREERHLSAPLKISFKSSQGTRVVSGTDSSICTITDNNIHLAFERFRFLPSRRHWEAFVNAGALSRSDYWNTSGYQTRNKNDVNLIRRIIQISETRAEKEKLNRVLEHLIPSLKEWDLELERGARFIRYKTKSGWHSANVLGDGVISLFRIAVAIYDLQSGEDGILVIDEPELSLHPQAQKRLSALITELAKSYQIILTTHSPYFVNWRDLHNGARMYRLHKTQIGECYINFLRDNTVANLKHKYDYRKPHEMDAVAREIFFADDVVFVEGAEDVGLLKRFIEERTLTPIEFFGYGVGGADKIDAYLQMAEDLGLATGAIYDKTHSAAAETARNKYKKFKNSICTLVTNDIRSKPDRGIEGIFDEHGDIMPQHERYLIELLGNLRNSLDSQGQWGANDDFAEPSQRYINAIESYS